MAMSIIVELFEPVIRDSQFEAKLSTIRNKFSKPYDTEQFEEKKSYLDGNQQLPIRAVTRQSCSFQGFFYQIK